jgi:hypothetical protein
MQQATGAILGGQARNLGINVSVDKAMGLSRAGVEDGSRAFAQLAEQKDLYTESIYDTEDLKIEDEGVDMAFGRSGQAVDKVTGRLAERRAAFSGSGGALTSDAGVIGLGTAR